LIGKQSFLARLCLLTQNLIKRTDIGTQPLGPTILEVLNEPQKNGRVKEAALESGTFIINSRNKSEGKVEERPNSLQSRIATHNVIQKYKSTRD
jgi:hypothetical protein